MSTSPSEVRVKRAFNRAVDESDRRDGSSGDSRPLRERKDVEHNGTAQPDVFVEFINYGMDDQMVPSRFESSESQINSKRVINLSKEIKGFIRDRFRTVTTWILIVVTFGSLRLVFHWWPRFMLYCTHRSCSLETAEKVLITECYQKKHRRYYVKDVRKITSLTARDELKDDEQDVWDQNFLLDLDNLDACKLSVHVSGGLFKSREEVRAFTCKKMIYVWDPDDLVFYKLRGLDWDVASSTLHQAKGLSMIQQYFRRAVYGKNEIIIPSRSVVALLFLEVLNPFYIFQIFSFTLWSIDDYIYYACAIALMSCTSIVFAVIQTRKNQLNLSSRVHSSDVANVLRAGSNDASEVVTIPTSHLVPGDVLVIPKHGCIMHCDAVLLTGNCIVNESMLTGESVPVTKTPMPNSPNVVYSDKEHARHTLFCGTQVIQTRYYGHENVYAVVIRTAFSTAKGNLVRSILYPPPVDFKFEQDSYKFVQLLASFAVLGVVYTFITKANRQHPFGQILLEALDLVTIVVPPALPAAMTVGRMYAQGRLEKSSIFCISPRTINVAGSINCVCFDKTGTLTEDGLDMWGVVPVSDSNFLQAERIMRALKLNHLLKAMVTCHSITIIDGSLAGDPLDIKMFESTGWTLEEPEVSDDAKFDLICPTIVKPPHSTVTPETIDGLDFEIGIIRQFPFSSSLQRMSVITRILGAKKFTLYCKGSPEMIRSLCDPVTVPRNFDLELDGYTKEGYRVLGIAYRDLPAKLSYAKMQRLSREDAETELIFLGFVVMENRLKPQTSGVLAMLRDAKIKTVMVTGDNMLTALSVARDCGIVPQGKRVIMVNTTEGPGKPEVYFIQSKSGPHLDTAHLLSETSQITATLSLASLQTINSTRVGNGTARNSAFSDLPVDVCYSENGVPQNEYSFALTGSTWTVLRDYYPDMKDRIVSRGAVFARMSPDHKQQLIQDLQHLNYFVAMVGDGANDCGALKAAHAGISLSEAESSVASPFTSKIPNISCIVQVIREGRAALATSFAIFKYMAAYSLMQFASVIILYSIDSNLTDIEYLYIDLFVITTFAFVLGRAEAYSGCLYPEPPESSLIATVPICSLLGHMILAVATQILSFTVVGMYEKRELPEYNTTALTNESVRVTNVEVIGSGLENYAVFSVSSLQYIILALVFSKGAPYRKPLYLTPNLMAAVVLITSFTLYLIVEPCSFLVRHFELTLPSSIEFRLLMIALGVGNAALSFVYESSCDFFQRLSRSSSRKLLAHEELEKTMSECNTWPPITTDSPPVVNSPAQPRPSLPPSKVTVVSSPPGKKSRNHSLGMNSVSDLQLEELKFSTPMRSVLSLNSQQHYCGTVNQSEDSLNGYLTPPSSLEATPQHVPSAPTRFF